MSRRGFLGLSTTKLIEIASVGPLVYLIANNFMESKQYDEIMFDDTINTNTPGEVRALNSITKDICNALDTLYNKHHDEFRESRQVVTYGTDDEGNLTTDWDTEYYWDEPSNIPDNYQISSWQNHYNGIHKKTNFLANHKLVDPNKVDSINIDKKESDKTVQGIISGVVYGTEIVLLLSYEEFIAKAQENSYYNRGKSMKQLVEETNSPAQIKRRSFFKVGAALTAGFVASKISNYNEERAVEGKKDLEKTVEEIREMKYKPVTSEETFSKYFGKTALELKREVANLKNVAHSSAIKSSQYRGVTYAYSNLERVCDNYLQSFDTIFASGIKRDFKDILTGATITEQIEENKTSINTNLGVFLETLAVGGTLAAILTPAEYINKSMN